MFNSMLPCVKAVIPIQLGSTTTDRMFPVMLQDSLAGAHVWLAQKLPVFSCAKHASAQDDVGTAIRKFSSPATLDSCT